MTQKNLIKEYCRLKGKIIPAKLKDSERAICGEWIGITAIRRCEEMALTKEMYRWPNEGKFAVFSLTPPPTTPTVANLTPTLLPMTKKVREWQKKFEIKQEPERQTVQPLF